MLIGFLPKELGMSSVNRCAGVAAACGSLVALARCAPFELGPPSPSYDLSAQAYDDAVHVYARRDLLGADAGAPQFTADIGGASVMMHSTNDSPSLAADFPRSGGSFTAHIREGKDAIATIEVPGAFGVAGAPATLHRGETLNVTLSPPPSAGTKVTLRAIQGQCPIYIWPDVPTLAKTLSSENGAAIFDLEPVFSAMFVRECDVPLGMRYETAGSLTSGRIGHAAGLREVRITVHLVNPSEPIFDAGYDDGDARTASGG
jgi:hypothetical protein